MSSALLLGYAIWRFEVLESRRRRSPQPSVWVRHIVEEDTMKRMLGAIVAGGLWLGSATVADAQFSLSVGSPYAGGVGYGLPGYYGYPSYGTAYAAPGATFYGSGYSGYSGC